MPNSRPDRTVPARKRLGGAATFGAVGLALSGIYAVSGYGLACPWRLLTHTLCPFCGATTMGARLLHADVGGAWQSNQFVFILLIGIGIACLAWTVELLGGPALRLRGRVATEEFWFVLVGAGAVLFALVRNLVPLG